MGLKFTERGNSRNRKKVLENRSDLSVLEGGITTLKRLLVGAYGEGTVKRILEQVLCEPEQYYL